MKWKTFFQIILLIVVAALAFYIVCPKYHFISHNEGVAKGNIITGEVQLNVW